MDGSLSLDRDEDLMQGSFTEMWAGLRGPVGNGETPRIHAGAGGNRLWA